jgi:hypothetical protein
MVSSSQAPYSPQPQRFTQTDSALTKIRAPPKTDRQKLLDFLYFIWYSTFWVRVRILSESGKFSAAFSISGTPNSDLVSWFPFVIVLPRRKPSPN